MVVAGPTDVVGVVQTFPLLDHVGATEAIWKDCVDLCRRLRRREMGVLGGSLHVLHDTVSLVDLRRVAFQHLIPELWNHSVCEDAKYHS